MSSKNKNKDNQAKPLSYARGISTGNAKSLSESQSDRWIKYGSNVLLSVILVVGQPRC